MVGRSVAACGRNRLIRHKHNIDKHGQDMQEIRNWKWSNLK